MTYIKKEPNFRCIYQTRITILDGSKPQMMDFGKVRPLRLNLAFDYKKCKFCRYLALNINEIDILHNHCILKILLNGFFAILE